MHPTNCLNCSTMLTADDRFCPTCGQKSDTHRLNMGHIWHDLVHAFTHADKGFLFTIRELALRPGLVAREYIGGKRKKYFNPFSFLVIVVGFTILANGIFKPYSITREEMTRVPASMKTESQKRKYLQIMERRYEMGEFINKHTNVVLFISTPFIAFILWLCFRRRKLFYAEHLAAIAYLNGFLNILTILIFGPLLYLTRGTPAHGNIYYLMLLSHVLYLAFLYYGFLELKGWNGRAKAIGAAVFAILCWSVFSLAIGSVYIMWGVVF